MVLVVIPQLAAAVVLLCAVALECLRGACKAFVEIFGVLVQRRNVGMEWFKSQVKCVIVDCAAASTTRCLSRTNAPIYRVPSSLSCPSMTPTLIRLTAAALIALNSPATGFVASAASPPTPSSSPASSSSIKMSAAADADAGTKPAFTLYSSDKCPYAQRTW